MLDRTLVKLPYDEDCTTAGRILELLLQRYVLERHSVRRMWVYTYSQSHELFAMVILALLQVFGGMSERLLGTEPVFGDTWMETIIVVSNMTVAFVAFSLVLSFLNISRLRLAAKLLRLQLFDALTDINEGE